MTADDVLGALDLPAATRVDQRVPKKLVLENGAPTTADRRALTEAVEECRWIAALKPHTIGVREYRDADREYMEIHVMRLRIRPHARRDRVIDLMHRAIPYPLLLVYERSGYCGLSAAHQRLSHSDHRRVVLVDEPIVVETGENTKHFEDDFLTSLAIGCQPQTSLFALYAGWMNTIVAMLAARRSGRFAIAATELAVEARLQALNTCATLEKQITRIRAAAAREPQIARRTLLNESLNSARAAMAAAEADL